LHRPAAVSGKAEPHPRIEKSWHWLVEHTSREIFPSDGYIQVTGKTKKSPLENLTWMMAWTCEALLACPKVFPS
jgi:hypothetical protein